MKTKRKLEFKKSFLLLLENLQFEKACYNKNLNKKSSSLHWYNCLPTLKSIIWDTIHLWSFPLENLSMGKLYILEIAPRKMIHLENFHFALRKFYICEVAILENSTFVNLPSLKILHLWSCHLRKFYICEVAIFENSTFVKLPSLKILHLWSYHLRKFYICEVTILENSTFVKLPS